MAHIKRDFLQAAIRERNHAKVEYEASIKHYKHARVLYHDAGKRYNILDQVVKLYGGQTEPLEDDDDE